VAPSLPTFAGAATVWVEAAGGLLAVLESVPIPAVAVVGASAALPAGGAGGRAVVCGFRDVRGGGPVGSGRGPGAAAGPGRGAGPAVGQRPARAPFWCRINEGKWFGGICLGISARGGFRVVLGAHRRVPPAPADGRTSRDRLPRTPPLPSTRRHGRGVPTALRRPKTPS